MTKEEANFLSKTLCGKTLKSVKTSGYKNPNRPNPTKAICGISKLRNWSLYIWNHYVKNVSYGAKSQNGVLISLYFQNAKTKTVVLEKSLESPLDSKKIKPDNPKGNHPWIFIGRSDAETEALTTWWEELTHWKRFWCWKDWRQEKGVTEDEMVGWHHRLNGHEFEQTSGDSEGQGSLACCSPWGCKELDMTEWLNRIST